MDSIDSKSFKVPVTCLCELASKEDLPKYLSKVVDIDNEKDFFRINLLIRQVFKNLPEAKKTLVKEEDCEAEVSGCFEVQIPKEFRGHHPAKDYKDYRGFILDQVFLSLDKGKDCDNGFAKWTIPVEILQDDYNLIQTTVVQEYILKDRKITIIKGDCLVLDSYPID